MKEIASIMGISESRVCQLHGRALARAVSHSSPGCLTSVLVVAFPGADLGGRGQPSCRPLGRSSWRRLGAPLRSFHHHRLLTVMPVLTPIPAAAVTPLAAPTAAGPDCSLQRSGALWQLISWPSWRSHLPATCSALATSCPPWCTSETRGGRWARVRWPSRQDCACDGGLEAIVRKCRGIAAVYWCLL